EPPVEGAPGRILMEPAYVPEEDEEGKEREPAPLLAGEWNESQWQEAAERCWSSSTSWFETSVQPSLTRNYAHFASRHAPGSKYLTEYFRLRSQIFRPKTRSMVRRSEAAMAVALFSTADLLDVDAWDDTNR